MVIRTLVCRCLSGSKRKLCSFAGEELSKPKAEIKALQQQRLKSALNGGQRLVLDFGLHGSNMTDEDGRRLVKQTKLLYDMNKNAIKPFALTFAEIGTDSKIHCQFEKSFVNFSGIVANVTEKSITENLNKNELIYLTPDSTEALEDLDIEKAYVLGGLVDYQVSKNLTRNKALNLGIETRRLPIPEYMNRNEGKKFGYSKILAINQVFQILLKYQETKDWRTALTEGIPLRKGYIPKPL